MSKDRQMLLCIFKTKLQLGYLLGTFCIWLSFVIDRVLSSQYVSSYVVHQFAVCTFLKSKAFYICLFITHLICPILVMYY